MFDSKEWRSIIVSDGCPLVGDTRMDVNIIHALAWPYVNQIFTRPYKLEDPESVDLERRKNIGLFYLCGAISFTYERAALLGCIAHDKTNALEGTLLLNNVIEPNIEGEIISLSKKLSQQRLDRFMEKTKREPHTFNEFIMRQELERTTGWDIMGLISEMDRLQQHRMEPRIDRRKFEQIYKKIPSERAGIIVQMFGLEGLGFGISFPELTKKLFGNYYESIVAVSKTWDWEYYLATEPDWEPFRRPSILTLEEQEDALLNWTAAFCLEHHHQALESLDLVNRATPNKDEARYPSIFKVNLGADYFDWAKTSLMFHTTTHAPEEWLGALNVFRFTFSSKKLRKNLFK